MNACVGAACLGDDQATFQSDYAENYFSKDVLIKKTHAARFKFPMIDSASKNEIVDNRSQLEILAEVVDILNFRYKPDLREFYEIIIQRDLTTSLEGPLFHSTRKTLREATKLWKEERAKIKPSKAEAKFFDDIDVKLQDDRNDAHNEAIFNGSSLPAELTSGEKEGRKIVQKQSDWNNACLLKESVQHKLTKANRKLARPGAAAVIECTAEPSMLEGDPCPPGPTAPGQSSSPAPAPSPPAATNIDVNLSVPAPALPPADKPTVEVRIGDQHSLPYIVAAVGCKNINNNCLHTCLLTDSAASHCCVEITCLDVLKIPHSVINTSTTWVLTTCSSNRQSGVILGSIIIDLQLISTNGDAYCTKQEFLVLRTGVLEFPIYSVQAMRRRQQTIYLGMNDHENYTDLYAINVRTGLEEYARFKLCSLDQMTTGQVFNESRVNLVKGDNHHIPFIVAPEPGTMPARVVVQGRDGDVTVPRQVVSCPPALTSWGDVCPTFSCHLSVISERDVVLDQVEINLACSCSNSSDTVTEVTCHSSLLTDPAAKRIELDPELTAAPEDQFTEPAPVRDDENFDIKYCLKQMQLGFKDESDYQDRNMKNKTDDILTPDLSHLSPADRDDCLYIMSLFPGAFAKSKYQPGSFLPYQFSIPTIEGAPPARDTPRSHNWEKLEGADEILERLEAAKIVETCENSAYNCNYILVLKPDTLGGFVQRSKADRHVAKQTELAGGGKEDPQVARPKRNWRLCLDLRSLNRITVPFGPIKNPTSAELRQRLNNQICTSTDYLSSFFQCKIRKEDRHKFAFFHRNRCLQLCALPMGWVGSTHAQQAVQATRFGRDIAREFAKKYKFLMDKFNCKNFDIRKFISCTFTHGDDTLTHSNTMDEAKVDLAFILYSMERVGLNCNAMKSYWLTRRFTYCGESYDLRPGQNCNLISESRLAAILKYRVPSSSLAELCSRLASLNYWSKFCPAFKVLAAPLFYLLKSSTPKWTALHQRSWNNCIFVFSLCIKLYLPIASAHKIISVDAGALAHSSMIQQLILEGPEKEYLQPIMCDSRLFSVHGARRGILLKELLAIIASLQLYEFIIAASTNRVTLCSDAASLMKIQSNDCHAPNFILASMLLSQFPMVELQNISGTTNFCSDLLSRLYDYKTNSEHLHTTVEYGELSYPLPQQLIRQGEWIDNSLLRKLLATAATRDTWNCDPRKSIHQPPDFRLPSRWLAELAQPATPEEQLISAARRGFSALNLDSQLFREFAAPQLKLSPSQFKIIWNKYKLQHLRDKMAGLPQYTLPMSASVHKLILTEISQDSDDDLSRPVRPLISNNCDDFLKQTQQLAQLNNDLTLLNLVDDISKHKSKISAIECFPRIEDHLNEFYSNSNDSALPPQLRSSLTAPPDKTDKAGRPRSTEQTLVVIVPYHLPASSNNDVYIEFNEFTCVVKAARPLTLSPHQALLINVNLTLFVAAGQAVKINLKLDSPCVASRCSVLCGLNSFHLSSITALSCVELSCDEGTELVRLDNFLSPPTNPRRHATGLIGCNCGPAARFVTEKREVYESQKLIIDLSCLAGAAADVQLLEAKICSGDIEEDDEDSEEVDRELSELDLPATTAAAGDAALPRHPPGPAPQQPPGRPARSQPCSAITESESPAREDGFHLRSTQLDDVSRRIRTPHNKNKIDLFPAAPNQRNVVNQAVLIAAALQQRGQLDNKSLIALQESDATVLKLKRVTLADTDRQTVFRIKNNLLFREAQNIVGSETVYYSRLVLPSWVSRLVLESVHKNSDHNKQIYSPHFKVNNMAMQFNLLFYCPSDQVVNWAKEIIASCSACRIGRDVKKRKSFNLLRNIIPHFNSNSVLSIDHMYLPKSRQGNRFLLLVACWRTGYCIGLPQSDLTAQATLHAFKIITGIVGRPACVVADSSTSFAGLFAQYLNTHNITFYRSAPRRSEQLGRVEAKVKEVKKHLSLVLTQLQQKDLWEDVYPSVMIWLNSKLPSGPAGQSGLSRFQRYFGSLHYNHGSYDVDLISDNGTAAAEKYRTEVLDNDSDLRERQPPSRPAKPKQWRANMFIIREVDRQDRQKIDGTRALSASRPNLYQILRVDSSANTLECLELQSGTICYLSGDEVTKADLPLVFDAENDISSFLVSSWQIHKRRNEFLPVFKFFSAQDNEQVFGDEIESEAAKPSSDTLPAGLGPVLPDDPAASRPGLRPRPARPGPPAPQPTLDKTENEDDDDLYGDLAAGAADGDCDEPPVLPGPPAAPLPSAGELGNEAREIVREALAVTEDTDLPVRQNLKRLLQPTPALPGGGDEDGDAPPPPAPAPPPLKRKKKIHPPPSRHSARLSAMADVKTVNIHNIVMTRAGTLPAQVLPLCSYLLGSSPSPLSNTTQFDLIDRDTSMPSLSNLGLSFLHWSQTKKPGKSCVKNNESNNSARKSVQFNPYGLFYCETNNIRAQTYKGYVVATDIIEHSPIDSGCLESLRRMIQLQYGKMPTVDSFKELTLLTDKLEEL